MNVYILSHDDHGNVGVYSTKQDAMNAADEKYPFEISEEWIQCHQVHWSKGFLNIEQFRIQE